MFKHYLLYQQALTFHQRCLLLPLNTQQKNLLLIACEKMVKALTDSLHTQIQEDEESYLKQAKKHLEDAKGFLEWPAYAKVCPLPMPKELQDVYDVIHNRLTILTYTDAAGVLK